MVFDADAHLARLADILPHRVKCGQRQRGEDLSDEEGITWAGVLVAVTTPDVLNEATRDSQDSIRFTTTMSMTLDEAKQKNLFGVSGFQGFVWNSPSLGTVALQSDIASTPNKVRIIDPNSWFWLTMGQGMYGIEWLKTAGSRFSRVDGATNKTPTFYIQAAAWTAALLACDQPGANAEVTGVKTSLI